MVSCKEKKRATDENKNKTPEYLQNILGSVQITPISCRHFYVIGKNVQKADTQQLC